MDTRLIQFHENTLQQFQELLKKKFGVTDACEYLELVSGLPDPLPDSVSINDKELYEFKRRKVIEYASKLNVSAHFRCFPPQNQNIAFILKESATASSPDYYYRAQGRLHDESESIEEITRLSATYLPTYLDDLQYGNNIIQKVRTASSGLDTESSFAEYIHLNTAEKFKHSPVARSQKHVPIDEGFFADFYFTNVNKYPLPANGDYPELVERNKDIILEELDLLNPSLIICCAKSAWEAILNSSTSVTPVSKDEIVSKYGGDEPNAINEIWEWGDTTVLTLGHPNRHFWGGPDDEITEQAVIKSVV